MAKTFTYTDVLNVVGKAVPKTIEDQFSSLACNVGTNLAWYGYDWRESLKTLPPFYLIANEQDHKLPPAIVPSDFHGLRKCQLSQIQNTSIHKRPLDPTKDLQLTHIKDIPKSIAYEPSISGFRLFPRVPENMGAPEWFVEGTYKCRPTKITNVTLSTTLPFDDMYFNVLVECVRWGFQMLSGSPVAAQQLPLALTAIDQMATQEGLNDGDPRISPSEALIGGNISGDIIGFNLYG